VILSHMQRKNGWWFEERATVQCALPADGLVVVFNRVDVEATLDLHYPHARRNGEKVWWFNTTKDREIAESDGDIITANPRILWDHFMQR